MILELPDQVGYFSAGPNLALAGMQKVICAFLCNLQSTLTIPVNSEYCG